MYIFIFIVHKVNNPTSGHSMQQITSEHQIPRGIVYRLKWRVPLNCRLCAVSHLFRGM